MVKNQTGKEEIISRFGNLSRDERIDVLASLVSSLKEGASKDSVPVSIFDNKKLSVFEALVKYMKENLKMRFVDIGRLLERSDKTVWTTYSKAKKKLSGVFSAVGSEIDIPLEVFFVPFVLVLFKIMLRIWNASTLCFPSLRLSKTFIVFSILE